MIRIKPSRIELKQEDIREYESAKSSWAKPDQSGYQDYDAGKKIHDERNARIGLKSTGTRK